MAVSAHLWQSFLVIAALLLLGRLLERAPGRYADLLYRAALIKLFLPLAWVGGGTAAFLAALARRSSEASPDFASAIPAFILVGPLGAASEAAVQRSATGWFWLCLTALWLGGVLAIVTRWGIADRSWKGRSVHCDEAQEEIRQRLLAALEGTGIATGRISVGGQGVPAARGILHGRIRIPEAAVRQLNTARLRAILLHEEEHLRRHDPFFRLLGRLAFALFFYFPPVWVLLRSLEAAAEVACDERVLGSGVRPGDYLQALARTLSLGLSSAPGVPAVGGKGGSMKHRFDRIRHAGQFRPLMRHRLALLSGFAFVIAATGWPAVTRAGNAGQQAAPAGAGAGVRMSEIPVRSSPPADPAADRSEPMLVEGNVEPPQKILNFLPNYPEEARLAKAEGKVILECIIGRDGKVREARALREVAGWPSLTQAAEEAVLQWEYRPARQFGRPVPVYFTVIVEFNLDRFQGLEVSRTPILLLFRQTPLAKIFDAIEQASGVTILGKESIPAIRVTLNWPQNRTLSEALGELGRLYDLNFEVVDAHTIRIVPAGRNR